MIIPGSSPSEFVTLQGYEPLSILQLSIIAEDIISDFVRLRPEFASLVKLQRNAGTRVTELFRPTMWKVISSTQVQLEPQKRNATRILNFSDIGITSRGQFEAILTDMARLPKRQYERFFATCVQKQNLWRLYDEGYLHPSTHFLRHLKIKELATNGYDTNYIATWIGEKNPDNLNYYLNSQFFI